LQEVALRHFNDQSLKVSEMLNMKHLGLAATLHKRLERLRRVGLLSVRHEATDHRIKYLIATPLAMRHFERMGQAMKRAILS
jgi:replication initiation and membrane attachment protein DnaB